MSNIINSNAYVKQGDKVYKVNGGAGSPIHHFNSVEEMNAANLADGSIACVPSAALDIVFPTFGEGAITDETVIESLNAFLAQGVGAFTLNFEVTDPEFTFAGSFDARLVSGEIQMFTGLVVFDGVIMFMLMYVEGAWGYTIVAV